MSAQDLHGAEDGPLGTPRAERRWALGDRARQHRTHALLVPRQPAVALLDERGAQRARLGSGQKAREATDHECGHVFAVGREDILAVDLDVEAGVVGLRLQFLLEVVRHPLFDHEDVALPAQEADQLLGHRRMQHVEHEQGHRRPALGVGQTEHVKPAQRRVPEPALHDDPEVALLAPMVLVQSPLDDVAAGRRQALLELLRLHGVGEGREVDALDVEARAHERRQHADGGTHVVAARKLAAHVAGTDPDAEEHRLMAGLGQPEAFLHEARERRQAVARIDQRHARLERSRVRALLEDAGPLTVVFADHDQRTTDDPGGRDVGERIGRDVGADHRLPGDGPAHRIVDGGAE